jgi:hypothetical protein
MNRHADHDPLGVEADHEKLEADDPDLGPSVAQMATTHGTAFVTDQDQADRLASDETDGGMGSDDGLGNPPPAGQGDGRT